MDFNKKAAYLKGLIEGINFDKSNDEMKVINTIVDLLDEMSCEIEKLKLTCSENKELIYEIDEDLGAVEAKVSGCSHGKKSKGAFFDECLHKNNFGNNGGCGGCKGLVEHGDYVDRMSDERANSNQVNDEDKLDDEFDDDLSYKEHDEYDSGDDGGEEKYEVLCPHCSYVISLDDDSLSENEIICPNCGKELEFDLSGDSTEKDADF